MYKYGIISTASITPRFIDGIRKAGDEVICVGSRDINKAKKFAIDNDIEKYYGSYLEVYEDKDVDVVYIPVINNLHYECTKDALLHKKNVVLEKPFTLRTSEAIDLYNIAKANSCFLFEGVKNLFVPSTKFVKDNLDKIGKVDKIITLQGIRKPFPEGHWMNDISQGGGAYIGSASYVYHYLHYLFNKEISNIDGTYIPSSDSDLICYFNFDLGDIKVESTIDMSQELEDTCVLYGTKGKIIIDEFWRSHHVLIETTNGDKLEFKDEGNEFVHEVKHIQDCLNKGLIESPIMPVSNSIAEVDYIMCLYKKWDMYKLIK